MQDLASEEAAGRCEQPDRQGMPCKVGSALTGNGKAPKSKRQLKSVKLGRTATGKPISSRKNRCVGTLHA